MPCPTASMGCTKVLEASLKRKILSLRRTPLLSLSNKTKRAPSLQGSSAIQSSTVFLQTSPNISALIVLSKWSRKGIYQKWSISLLESHKIARKITKKTLTNQMGLLDILNRDNNQEICLIWRLRRLRGYQITWSSRDKREWELQVMTKDSLLSHQSTTVVMPLPLLPTSSSL